MKLSSSKHGNSLSGDYLFELKEWVRYTINEAKKNGNVLKRKRFLALRAELL